MGADIGLDNLAVTGLEPVDQPEPELGSGLDTTTLTEEPEVQAEEPQPTAEPESELEGEKPPEPQQPQTAKELSSKDISRAIRQFKEEHPEHQDLLKRIENGYYSDRRWKQVFPSGIDEARTMKTTLDSLGGTEGISRMRSDIQSIEAFDQMAVRGDPEVMNSLAEEYPDGFKRLVPAALDRLSRMDAQTYRETMRGPLLQMLDGDGLTSELQIVMEELKAGETTRAAKSLDRIAGYLSKLRNEEGEYRNRYRDPRLQELQQREADLQKRQTGMMREHVESDLASYLSSGLDSELAALTKDYRVPANGLSDLKMGVMQEVVNQIKGNSNTAKFYRDSMNNLISSGDKDRAVSFAKPYLDQFRKSAIQKVWGLRNWGAAQARPRQASGTNGNNGATAASAAKVSSTPSPVLRPPSGEEIDWSKDPTRVRYIGGEATLRNGKVVRWNPNARR